MWICCLDHPCMQCLNNYSLGMSGSILDFMVPLDTYQLAQGTVQERCPPQYSGQPHTQAAAWVRGYIVGSLGSRLKMNPSVDHFQYTAWKQYMHWMKSGDETQTKLQGTFNAWENCLVVCLETISQPHPLTLATVMCTWHGTHCHNYIETGFHFDPLSH